MPNPLFPVAFLAILSVGCASNLPLTPGHHIAMNEDGIPVGHFKNEFTTLGTYQFIESYINPIIDGIEKYVQSKKEAREIPQVLLFIHGGLNGYDDGRKHVLKLLEAQNERYKPTNHSYYPSLSSYYLVSINWEAGLRSALLDYFFRIRAGEHRPVLAPLTSPFVFAGAVGDSVLNLPRDMYYAYLRDIFTQQGPQLSTPAVAGTVGGAEYAAMISAAGGPPFAQIIIPAVPAGVGAYSFPVVVADPTFYLFGPIRMLSAPFIDGFGRPAWDMLKRRPDFVLINPEVFIKEDGQRGAGHYLINRISERVVDGHWITDQGEPIPIKLVLAGHSMGAAVSDRILQNFRDEIRFDDIVYMGAANSIADFHQSVVPYLRQHTKSRFWSFSLSDREERSETYGIDLLMRGSLLVWIESLFEPQHSLLNRRFGRAASQNYVAIDTERDELAGPDERIWPRICRITFGGDQIKEREPHEHGDFTNPVILETVLSIMQAQECSPPVDINTASPAVLKAIPGLASSAVEAIIDHRPYADKEDLVDRQIISDAKYQCIKHYLAPVNINSVEADQLARLLQGDKHLANQIIATRHKLLFYRSVEDLAQFVTRSVYDRINGFLTVKTYPYQEPTYVKSNQALVSKLSLLSPAVGPQACVLRKPLQHYANLIQGLLFDGLTGQVFQLSRTRRREIAHQEQTFRRMVIQEINKLDGAKLLSEMDDELQSKSGGNSWDAILQIGGRRVGLDIHVSAELGEYGPYKDLYKEASARRDFIDALAEQAKRDPIAVIISVWDKDVFNRRGMDQLAQLGRDTFGENFMILHGLPHEVALDILRQGGGARGAGNHVR